MFKCPLCGREFNKYGIRAHLWYHSEEGKKWSEERSKEPRKPLSEETKRKISEKAKERLRKDPSKVPFLLNNSCRQSYPEKYFEDFFKNHSIPFEKEKYACGYWLDFCFGGKYYVEIDGEQHYVIKENIEHDRVRTEKLSQNGYVLLQRVRWKFFKRLKSEEKEEYLEKLLRCITEHNNEYIEYNLKNEEEKKIKKVRKIRKIRKRIEKGEEEERKLRKILDLILNSGVDLMKSGYIKKISEKTGLRKGDISKTLKFFRIKTYIRHIETRDNSIMVSALGFEPRDSCSIQDYPAKTGQEGSRNHSFNSCWISNPVIKKTIKIRRESLEDFIVEGWLKRRVMDWSKFFKSHPEF